MEISEMSHTESPVPVFWVPQQLPRYAAFMCKLLLGKSEITFGSEVQLDFNMEGDQHGILSAQF